MGLDLLLMERHLNYPSKVEADWAGKISGNSITMSSDVSKAAERGEHNLTGAGGISKKAIFKYYIEVSKAGLYQFEYRVASARDTKGFEVFSDDTKVGENLIIKSGDYHKWQTQQGKAIYLKEGKCTLTLAIKILLLAACSVSTVSAQVYIADEGGT